MSWSSSDEGVASVVNGAVTAVSVGTVTITATADGISGTAEITVVATSEEPVDRVEVEPTQLRLRTGGASQIVARAFDAQNNLLARPTIWASDDDNVATVDSSGLVVAQGVGTTEVIATIESRSARASIEVEAQIPSDIDIDPSAVFQTMKYLEATAQIGQFECDRAAFDRYRDDILRRSVREVGVNRLRLEVRSYAENPTDHWRQLTTGQIDYNGWRSVRYEAINDNDDPFSADLARFSFGELDDTMRDVVVPLQNQLQQVGQQLYINLTFVAFGEQGSLRHYENPEEYAELIEVIFDHLQSNYGTVPDAVEVILEPDVAPGWSNAQVAQALVAAGNRLAGRGWTPSFIAPSNTDAQSALNTFNSIWSNPGVQGYLKEFSFHRYSGHTPSVLTEIGNRAQQTGVETSMLEPPRAFVGEMLEDIEMARVSTWSPYALGYCVDPNELPQNNRNIIYSIVDDPSNPQLNITDWSKPVSHFWRHMRPNSVRHGVRTARGDLRGWAFLRPDARWNIVIKTNAATTFSLGSMPTGTYGIFYSTDSDYSHELTEVSISNGDVIPVSVPGASWVTIYQK